MPALPFCPAPRCSRSKTSVFRLPCCTQRVLEMETSRGWPRASPRSQPHALPTGWMLCRRSPEAEPRPACSTGAAVPPGTVAGHQQWLQQEVLVTLPQLSSSRSHGAVAPKSPAAPWAARPSPHPQCQPSASGGWSSPKLRQRQRAPVPLHCWQGKLEEESPLRGCGSCLRVTWGREGHWSLLLQPC